MGNCMRRQNNPCEIFHYWEFYFTFVSLKRKKMKIIDSEKLEKFIRKHVDADKPIQKWIETCEAANWKNHSDLKMIFFLRITLAIAGMYSILKVITIGLLLS